MASVINTLSKWCEIARGSLNLRLLYVSQPHGDKSLQAFRQHPCLILASISCTYSSWWCNKESFMRRFGWTLCSAYRGLFLQPFFVGTVHVLLSSCARVVHLLFLIFIILCYIWALLNGISLTMICLNFVYWLNFDCERKRTCSLKWKPFGHEQSHFYSLG